MATAVQQAADVTSSVVKSAFNTVNEVTTNGTNGHAAKDYSAQAEAQDLLLNGIIRNPLMKSLPAELEGLSKHVRFEGNPTPSIPINWRFAESIAYALNHNFLCLANTNTTAEH
jgi:hypothetical protein